MFWNWLFSRGGELFQPVRSHLYESPGRAFRVLLLIGDLLMLAVFLSLQEILPHHQVYDLWLAGFAATLGMLSVCTIGSALINGYRLYRDPWVQLATTLMFALSFVAVASAF